MNRQVGSIVYELSRRDRKTASIYVERDGHVSLHAPRSISDDQADQLIQEKRYWILKSLAEWRALNASRVNREFVNGEGFPYLGRYFRLQLVEEQDQPLLLKNGYFQLRATGNGKPALNPHEAFKAFYRAKGHERLPDRVAHFAPKLGIGTPSVRVMELRNRWASCSKKGLNFHWKCMMAPLTVIDYIVLHELTHLIHPNHSDAFWNELEKLMPDYREKHGWLRANGASLTL